MTSESSVILCPYCNSPFKSNGINRHITKAHPGMAHVGKDKDNSSSVASPCQSEPLPLETGIPEPIIGDEALRANVDPMDEAAYTELDAPDPLDREENETMKNLWKGLPEREPSGIDSPPVEIPEPKSDLYRKLEYQAPIPNSPQKVISQIPVNSEIMLQGECFWQNPATFDWELATADKLQVVVVGLETVDNVVHLMCKVAGGQALWSVLQSDVLEGKYRIIKLANSVPISSPIAPPNGKREFAEAQEDVRKRAFDEFLPIFNTYLEAKEKLEVAEKMFADVHESSYQTIENFVLQYGETIEDEGDTPYCVLEVDGVRMRLVAGDGMIFEKIGDVENV